MTPLKRPLAIEGPRHLQYLDHEVGTAARAFARIIIDARVHASGSGHVAGFAFPPLSMARHFVFHNELTEDFRDDLLDAIGKAHTPDAIETIFRLGDGAAITALVHAFRDEVAARPYWRAVAGSSDTAHERDRDPALRRIPNDEEYRYLRLEIDRRKFDPR